MTEPLVFLGNTKDFHSRLILGKVSSLYSGLLAFEYPKPHNICFKCRLWDYVTVCQRLPSCLAACHPAHHLFGSSPPTPSIYPSVFCASLQSGGIVGQGHWDNPLVLCRINDRALSYTQLGPTTTQQLPPSSSLALTDRLWLNSFSSRRLHLSVPFCGFSPCHRERPAFKTEGEKRIVYSVQVYMEEVWEGLDDKWLVPIATMQGCWQGPAVWLTISFHYASTSLSVFSPLFPSLSVAGPPYYPLHSPSPCTSWKRVMREGEWTVACCIRR